MPRRLLIPGFVMCLACGGEAQERAAFPRDFAGRIAALSEPGGFFDTDNLISNERSYQHALSALDAMGVRGGAYLGVGPDQNFTYIAEVRPAVAFIIDIRRDNLLLHLVFKALFELAPTRVEYASLLLGRPLPRGVERWRDATIDELTAQLAGTPPSRAAAARARFLVDSAIATLGVALTAQDSATIDRFHRTFITEGLALRFRTLGQEPRAYYPTLGDLLAERDLEGAQRNYLSSDERYQVVRALQLADLVIPVVGDLAGPHALRAIGGMVAQEGTSVSAFYTSNVEFYLYRGGAFERFVANTATLPRSARSVIIRSVFRGPPDLLKPGYASAQLVQRIEALVEGYARGRFRSYGELVRVHEPD
jgi:hypothetical protein